MVQNTADGQLLINELGLPRQPMLIIWGQNTGLDFPQ